MPKKNNFWNENEFVTYEEYANFGISGEVRERNLQHSMRKKLDFDKLCPFCCKPLKKGSYKTLINVPNDTSNYYFNPNVKGEQINVGNGCFKHIMEAYREKYGKE